MRRKKTAFLSCAAVATVALLAAPAAMATGYSCSSFYSAANVTVVAGPCPVDSKNPSGCSTAGPYTGIRYKVEGSPSYIAALVTANNAVVSTNYRVYPACQGDPATDLGEQSCHEKAVTFNCTTATTYIWIVVEGRRGPVLQSVALKNNKGCVKSFAVTGLGYEISQFQATAATESVDFKGCVVDFVTDPLTGAVLSASWNRDKSTIKDECPAPPYGTNPPDPGSCCSNPISFDVSKLSIGVNDSRFGNCTAQNPCSLGFGQFGSGYVSSGTNSCTTRVIGGRVYTWGSPCPEE